MKHHPEANVSDSMKPVAVIVPADLIDPSQKGNWAVLSRITQTTANVQEIVEGGNEGRRSMAGYNPAYAANYDSIFGKGKERKDQRMS